MNRSNFSNPEVAAVVLAAGAGSRFERSEHKLTALIRGRSVLDRTLDAVCDAGFNEVLLVQGALDLSPFAKFHDVTLVDSPNWAQGQAHSLQAAIAVARERGHLAVVVGLGDQPMVPTSAWRSVGASAGLIVTATFDRKRRPPVKLHRDVWDDLPTQGDEGARALMLGRPELVQELPCHGDPADIDTSEDLAKWN
jgi:molybdenum cofactor cytidylyltransferase